jgi:DNA-directed RNA polymerase specialized sigma subunit
MNGKLNFDTRSYEFDSLDLKIAVSNLARRDQDILILHLMGHRQTDIGKVYNVSRSMISKRMRVITGSITRQLSELADI